MAITLALFELGLFFAVACFLFLTSNQTGGIPNPISFMLQALAITFAFLVSFYYNDLYDLRIVRSLTDFVPRLVQGFAIAFFILAAFYFLFPGQAVDGPRFLGVQILMALLIVGGRAICYRVLRDGRFSEKVLILGESPLAKKIVHELTEAPFLRYSVPGIISDLPDGAASYRNGTPILGGIDRASEIIQAQKPDRLVVAIGERRGRFPVWGLLSTCLSDVLVEDGVEFYERITRKLAVESMNPSNLLFSKDFRKPRIQLLLRRMVSLAFALLGFFLSLPLMVLLAIAIKLDSKGPVFFNQERVGMRGRVFRLIKFRTMHEPNGESQDSVWHRENESRVTRIGKWLRMLRLDELPQFWNILRGDMDVVGPRPEMASNVPEMSATIPFYSLRTSVRPGVTGWAQIKNGYALTEEEVKEKLRYDLYYIKHMSLGMDLRILLDTVKTVVSKRGT
ncbi:MAG: sugar transferase [Vicinamibacteria bacterium]